jgi:hypothetical protein
VVIRWFAASGARLGVTKVTGGSATVSGLGNGVPSYFPPPNNPSPGIVTFSVAGVAASTSSAFPGANVHATFVADGSIDNWLLPCSTTYPPQPLRLDGFTFSGANAPSSISVTSSG